MSPAKKSKKEKKGKGKVGILVGGGPAPGINGVISSASIEALNKGYDVIGIYDGFQWLSQGNREHLAPLSIDFISRIHFEGGSILRTSRVNPTKDPEKLKLAVKSLLEEGISYLITIGGDDTAYASSKIEETAKGKIKVVHVPKTIDNDLPLPGHASTFGFQTAREIGTNIVRNLMEDARTANRWFFLVAMGRKAGHLALGIGKAASATLTVIPEEWGDRERIRLREVCDIVEGAIIKRLVMGRPNGVAILAEGLAEKFAESELADLKTAERDAYGHIRLAEVDLGKIVKNSVRGSLEQRGIRVTIISKDIGYEMRCAPPIPFDCEYTKDLGYGAIKFLLEGGSGAMVTIQANKLVPIFFEEIIDPELKASRIRLVDIHTEFYEIARNYMIRLNPDDFTDQTKLADLAKAAKMSKNEFRKRFEPIADI